MKDLVKWNNNLSAICFFLEEIAELCQDEDDIAFMKGFANRLVKPDANVNYLSRQLSLVSGFAFSDSDLWKVTSHINTIKRIMGET